jgi:excisionase family DNA binding protein
LLDAEGVAVKLGVTKRWVYAETRASRIPHVRLGPRYVRYREQSIDHWLAALEKGAPGSRPGGFPDA